MTQDQAIIFAILAATIAMFMWGRWRHDMIATLALLACVLAGLVPDIEAFVGFGHPAVITVACVLVLSRGLQTTGAVDALAQRILPTSAGPTFTIAALTGLAATLSAFMNSRTKGTSRACGHCRRSGKNRSTTGTSTPRCPPADGKHDLDPARRTGS
jgi:di/tricarboxylate transporter